MRTKQMCCGMLVASMVLSISLQALAADPILVPPGGASMKGRVKSEKEVCCGKKVEIWKIDTPTYRDFNAAEKAAKNTEFENLYKTHVKRIGDATRAFNCHSYVFNSSDGWISDPANYEGDKKPCYKVDTAGPVYRWGSTHSANTGQNGFTYRGKCGGYPEADHDDAVYGANTNRWKQID